MFAGVGMGQRHIFGLWFYYVNLINLIFPGWFWVVPDFPFPFLICVIESSVWNKFQMLYTWNHWRISATMIITKFRNLHLQGWNIFWNLNSVLWFNFREFWYSLNQWSISIGKIEIDDFVDFMFLIVSCNFMWQGYRLCNVCYCKPRLQEWRTSV